MLVNLEAPLPEGAFALAKCHAYTNSIMHDAATKQAPAAAGEGVPRSAYVSRSHRDLTYGTTEQVVSVTGDVRVVQVDDNPYVIS
jgi:hypothetical protein